MRKIKVFASVPYVDGNEFTMEDLGLNENATEEEIEKVIHEMIIDSLDWGWEE